MSRDAPDNLRTKRHYLLWLAEAKGLAEASIDKAAAAIDRWIGFIGGADLRRFHTEKAVAFKRTLERERTETGAALSTDDAMLNRHRGGAQARRRAS